MLQAFAAGAAARRLWPKVGQVVFLQARGWRAKAVAQGFYV
jgi:hypothetical protein